MSALVPPARLPANDQWLDLIRAEPSTGNADIDFVKGMSPDHQGAIDMAKAVLLTTQDPQIRNLAQSIITEQAYEIQLMNSMLTQQRGSVAANPETSK